MTLGINPTVRSARMDAMTTFASTGTKIRFYSGTRPATGGAVTTLLAELTIAGALGAGASSGVLTLGTITGANASSTGTATWVRAVKSDGTTHIFDGDVAASASDLNMTSTAFVSGQPVAISSWTITDGNA